MIAAVASTTKDAFDYFAGLHHCRSIYGEQEMIQRQVLMLSLTAVGECAVHGRDGRRLRRGGLVGSLPHKR